MRVVYLDLADYLAIATEITGQNLDALISITRMNLAESALHAPAAGWGGTDLYPDFVDKAAVLVVRLCNSHPLPDGNKRAAWVCLRVFVELNNWHWAAYPSGKEDPHTPSGLRRRRTAELEFVTLSAPFDGPDRAEITSEKCDGPSVA